MSTTTVAPDGAGTETPPPSNPNGDAKVRIGDRIFRGMSATSSSLVLVMMAAIAFFLVTRAIGALSVNEANFLTYSQWSPDGDPSMFGIAALAFHTLVTSIIAMVLAVPIAVGIALFITFYAPKKLAATLAYLVDILAAVPSIVYGLWGVFFLAPQMTGLTLWLDKYFGWTVIFAYRPENIPNNKSDFTAGIVLAIMILPIVAALAREVFNQVPRTNIEAAYALGATRWEMIRMAVLPFGRPGIVSASILGLGRALGETMAVAYILSAAYDVNVHITESGGITFASNIALKFGEAGDTGTGALIASGMVLFLITLIVNSIAQAILRRGMVKD
ncbi:phosphate ABC transporter permease subunit PstC [Epidermidibacterium keratini]|uniref:Phosphate transport system permease protein n=1 Tax=Epidermidibacterium keratini TaxID=1891644 RepID=A0A7L4YKQ5_9ACTN|nr:phosphate ABC transporter permease subunit PstC [Epidermidibacterium keratini]QHB99844.1 phosphate ABC transporter permease subunit PstC [Epidermidibacterium keratini]